MPGVEFNVKWPVGELRVRRENAAVWDYTRSADPNDHYRPQLEKLVGRQGWDWNWDLRGNDCAENRLTIKIRRGQASHASYFALLWG